MRVAGLAGQAHVDGAGGAGVGAGLAGQFHIFQVDALVGVEVGVDLVGGHHRGQQRLAGVDQVALGDLGAADAAIDGGGDAGEAEVEPGVVQFRLGGGDGGLCFGGSAGAGIGQFGGDGVALTQALTAAGLVGSAGLVGAGLLQLGFQALDLSLEGTRVDLEQQVAFLHQAAFVEGHAVDVTGNARADFDGFGGFQAAGELIPLVEGLLDHRGDGDFRGCAVEVGFRCLATGDQYHCCSKGKGITPEILVKCFHGTAPPIGFF
ncbi:hypothetical protein D9M70_311620 [compost metagenome]